MEDELINMVEITDLNSRYSHPNQKAKAAPSRPPRKARAPLTYPCGNRTQKTTNIVTSKPTDEPKVPVTKGNVTDTVAGATTGGVPGKTAILTANDTTTLFTGRSTGGANPLDSKAISLVTYMGTSDTEEVITNHGVPT